MKYINYTQTPYKAIDKMLSTARPSERRKLIACIEASFTLEAISESYYCDLEMDGSGELGGVIGRARDRNVAKVRGRLRSKIGSLRDFLKRTRQRHGDTAFFSLLCLLSEILDSKDYHAYCDGFYEPEALPKDWESNMKTPLAVEDEAIIY